MTKISINQLQDSVLKRFNSALLMEDTDAEKISLSDIVTSSGENPTLEQIADNKIIFILKEDKIIGITYIKEISDEGEITLFKTLFAEESGEDINLDDYAKKIDLESYVKTEVLDSYAKKEGIPTKVSELVNDEEFITKAVENLEKYYLKTETYTQTEVDLLIAKVQAEAGQFNAVVVEALPTEDISLTTIYLVAKEDTEEDSNVYVEYMYIKEDWEIIGDTKIDISNFATIEQIEELEGLVGTEIPLETLEQTIVEVLNAHEKELEGVQIEINYLQGNSANTIKDFVNEVNTYDNKFEFSVGTMYNIIDENAPAMTVSEILEVGDPIEYIYTSDEDFLNQLDEEGIKISFYKFIMFNRQAEVDLDNVVYSDEENTFVENQTFEKDIVVNGKVLVNGEELITKAIENLENYYSKTETYTQEEVAIFITEEIGKLSLFDAAVVEELPTENISKTTFYLIAKEDNEEGNIYNEYLYINDDFELLGDTKIDISNLVSMEDFDALEDVAAKINEKNTFEQKQVFEGKIVVDGAAGICITGDLENEEHLCSSIKGYETEVDGIMTFNTEWDTKGDLDLNTGDYKLTKNGVKIATIEDISDNFNYTVFNNKVELTEESIYDISGLYSDSVVYHNLFLNGMRLNREEDYGINLESKELEIKVSFSTLDILELEIHTKEVKTDEN